MRIKELLRERGLTSKELAGMLGMTETGLSIAISDKGNPPLKRLEEIANALEVSICELFEPKDEVRMFAEYRGKRIEITHQDIISIIEHKKTTAK